MISVFCLAPRTRTVIRSGWRVRSLSGTRIWRARLFVLACVPALLASGCSKPVEPQSAVAIEYRISPQPVRVGAVAVTVKLRDAVGQPVPGAHINLEADMSHPGMAPVFGEVRQIAPAQYQGSLEFAMPGDWVVLIHVTLPDGRKLERQVSVPGVTAN